MDKKISSLVAENKRFKNNSTTTLALEQPSKQQNAVEQELITLQMSHSSTPDPILREHMQKRIDTLKTELGEQAPMAPTTDIDPKAIEKSIKQPQGVLKSTTLSQAHKERSQGELLRLQAMLHQNEDPKQ